MRTQVVLCVVGAGCALVALVFALREQSARAAQSRRAQGPAEVRRDEPAEERREELLAVTPPAAAEARAPAEAGDAEARRALEAVVRATPELSADLVAELLGARERGWIGDRELADFLARASLGQGDAQRAFELLSAYGSQDFGLWWSVAQTLGQQGDRAGQRAALLAALERWPEHQPLIDQLTGVDPAAAIALLREQLARQEAPGDPGLRARLARALVAGSGREEARALVEAMVAENPQDVGALAMLAEFDPARALALLESGFAEAEEPDAMRAAMLDILIGSGNPDAAASVLERFEREGHELDPNEWGMVAEAWLSNGDAARGTAALQRALVHEHGDPDSWVHRLEELAPEALLASLERRIAGDEALNDEYWGSLADSYWSFGRHADARAAWERAYELDRDDNEWPARLEALRAGRDPYDG